MAHPIFTPRLNNNDDFVRLVRFAVAIGDQVSAGQLLAEIETDKASVSVEADHAGFVVHLATVAADQLVPVGSVLIWLGDTADERVIEALEARSAPAAAMDVVMPTAKAKSLIAQYGLTLAEIPAHGNRVTAADVETFLATRRGKAQKSAQLESEYSSGDAARPDRPVSEGKIVNMTMEQRGMLRAVQWHRDDAAAAYLEIEFDQRGWDAYGQAFAVQLRMLSSPFLPLMAHRLVEVVAADRRINRTIVDGQLYVYEHVNAGFTIQVDDNLYLVVVHKAEHMTAPQFIAELNRLHRRAVSRQLDLASVQGATVAFSSMARWQVSRHIPILPAYTSLIVAHTSGADGRAVLGATYDHRVLTGKDVAQALHRLATAPDSMPATLNRGEEYDCP